ncbi:unnamed protein product [Musa textilis]
MQGDMNVYLRAFFRCQPLTWRQAAWCCSYGSHAGNFAVRMAFVSQLRGRYTSTSIVKLLPFEFMLNLIHFLPHGNLGFINSVVINSHISSRFYFPNLSAMNQLNWV